ncbi:hypothetical protein KL86CLO1_11206 [uncultured Eubacteriales bacterium]|uniref:Uncharacterized protein n=1 Tax=uncultured Eubacteriales bacterium TaxID=172733 RepID=A0A212JJN7_9FIRM|nr:hypothetical protein KL86CLO1_11206 [uncultured Eubacteriales bacterium]
MLPHKKLCHSASSDRLCRSAFIGFVPRKRHKALTCMISTLWFPAVRRENSIFKHINAPVVTPGHCFRMNGPSLCLVANRIAIPGGIATMPGLMGRKNRLQGEAGEYRVNRTRNPNIRRAAHGLEGGVTSGMGTQGGQLPPPGK